MGALLLGWACAMAGAWLGLLLCDAITYCSAPAARNLNLAQPTGVASGASSTGRSLIVPLASNGSRPCMNARLAAFVDYVNASRIAAGEEIQTDDVIVAAGGPGILFASLEKTLPAHAHVQRLTHPM